MDKRRPQFATLGKAAFGVVVVLVSALLFCDAAQATPYKVSELPVPPGFSTCQASRIDKAGAITGGCETTQFIERAVLWQNGAVSLLPLPSGFTQSWAAAISPNGEIVGLGYGSGPIYGLLWSNGGVQVLATLPGSDFTYAADINSSGVIVGTSDNHAVEWVNGQIIDFGGYIGVRPSAISDRGVFVGFGVINNGDVGGAFIDAGAPGDPLRYLYQSTLGEAVSINSDDEVVGFNRSSGGGAIVPWSWHYGRFTYLPYLAGTTSCIANSVNHLGHIVGFCGEAAVAVMWRQGAITNLNTLIPKNSGWQLQAATTINESESIVGDGMIGGLDQAFILTPTRPLTNILER